MIHGVKTAFCMVLFLLLASGLRAEAPARPKVAVFPLGGEASESERERAAFSIRAKLDRQAVYEPIDGPTMSDLAADRKIDFRTSIDEVTEWSKDEKPDLILWGEMGSQLKINVLDLRESKPKAVEHLFPLQHATDVRFAVEQLIERLPGSKKHEHATEEAVVRDDKSEALWKTNPNLIGKEGTFDAPGDWRALLAADKYAPELSDQSPATDKVVLQKLPDGQRALAMKLSRATAETYGLACVGGKIPIEPGTRYRIRFNYKSDGPTIRPFIKGYVLHNGEEREIYRRQVPPRGDTHGEWVEVVDDLNPQHTTFPVQYLRVDFYAYLTPGTVLFDDVILKAVGEPTRKAKDEALDKPVLPR